jgi:hypothetical protein
MSRTRSQPSDAIKRHAAASGRTLAHVFEEHCSRNATSSAPMLHYSCRQGIGTEYNMPVEVHPATVMLRGDDGYNPRNMRTTLLTDGTEILEVTYIDDGVRPDNRPRRPDRPFRFLLPQDVWWQAVNTEI